MDNLEYTVSLIQSIFFLISCFYITKRLEIDSLTDVKLVL